MKKLLKSGICGTYEQCMYALFTVDKVIYYGLEKKKKEKNAEEKRNATFIAIQTVTQQNNEHPWFYVNLQA